MTITNWLSNSNRLVFCLYTMLVAFATYSCMYAFRKPFAVATFDGMHYMHIDYKILLITSQVLGYTLSKFVGIKVISEQQKQNRTRQILLFIGIAEIALLLFALTPAPYNILFLFLNGLPLGMVWGVVFSYLEGRKTTELLGAGLCVSFIFSSGFVKSVGKWLLISMDVSEFWMPMITGLIFAIPLVIFTHLLDQVPDPNKSDVGARTERSPMNGMQRNKILREFGAGLVLLIFAYMILTAFRDFRDNFAAEIWQSLGYGTSVEVFTWTEIPVSLVVLVLIGLMILIKNNMLALMINHLLNLFGFLLIGSSTLLFNEGAIGPMTWMTFIGLGLYMGYVPFNSIFFDRMIATFNLSGNVGFLIYLADSFGYLGSVGVLFYKNFGHPNVSWLDFFKTGSLWISICGLLLTFLSMAFFKSKYRAGIKAVRVHISTQP